jgi:hypothetical protein
MNDDTNDILNQRFRKEKPTLRLHMACYMIHPCMYVLYVCISCISVYMYKCIDPVFFAAKFRCHAAIGVEKDFSLEDLTSIKCWLQVG